MANITFVLLGVGVVVALGLCAATALVLGVLGKGSPAARRSQPSDPDLRRSWWEVRSLIRPQTPARCPECNTAIDTDVLEGLCPRCLLQNAVSSVHDAVRTASPSQGQATPTGLPAVPSVEELRPLFPQMEILEFIGQGGMGAVYKARQATLDRLVAVKILPADAGRDPAFAERFNREARTLARLGHPNIVGVHEIGRAGDLYYIVMEFVEGINLRQLLQAGSVPPEHALQIIPQICDALQYAHEEGVVHRDIKPENILLDKKGRVKIADFGLAKLLGRDADYFTLTGSRQVMGTFYYMAPEQVERPAAVDHRADIYSLGVIFYEMLTGRLPVGHFPLPSEKAGTDAHLDEVVLHALEREPERRYQHASEVKLDVEQPPRNARPAAWRAAPVERQLALYLVTGPARALKVIALLGPLSWLCMLFLACGAATSREEDKIIGTVVVVFLMQAVIGALIFAGARALRRLDSYEFAVITCCLAFLQVTTPLFAVSIVVAIWSLLILGKREVREAFADNLRRKLRVR